jgi:hypothetical protein
MMATWRDWGFGTSKLLPCCVSSLLGLSLVAPAGKARHTQLGHWTHPRVQQYTSACQKKVDMWPEPNLGPVAGEPRRGAGRCRAASVVLRRVGQLERHHTPAAMHVFAPNDARNESKRVLGPVASPLERNHQLLSASAKPKWAAHHLAAAHAHIIACTVHT